MLIFSLDTENQRSFAFSIDSIDIGFNSQEMFKEVTLVALNSKEERRFQVNIKNVRISLILQKKIKNISIRDLSCSM